MKQSTKYIFLYVTASGRKEAQDISKRLLTKGLIACANYFPLTSMYQWKGKITSQKEFVMIFKTTEQKALLVKEEIKKIHSYKVPCIIKILVVPNVSYAQWLSSQLQGSSRALRRKS